jgi:1-pyrroline-5-carboxylate dehydrogenase
MIPDFEPVGLSELEDPDVQDDFQDAIDQVDAEAGKEYPMILGGEDIWTDDYIESIDPAHHDHVVGRVSKATAEHAEKAIEESWEAFETWRDFSGEERARVLWKACEIMKERRHELSATMVAEVSKNWLEADADTAEAIDFLNFYGHEADRLDQRQPLTRLPDRDNELYYIPLGAGTVISPWNFPLAILCGMTSASIAAGNTTAVKPASDSVVIGYKFADILREAGLPDGILNFLPGGGARVGSTLVEHPKTRFINFTGSREVGTHIYEEASKVREDQTWLKRVLAEMGGKDAVIVDNELYDVQEAVDGVVKSAFGFQGQKCSAGSRLILHDDVYDDVLESVVDRTEEISVGDPRDPEHYMGAVINQSQFDKICNYIDVGKEEAELLTGGEADDSDGYFIEPTIFAGADPDDRISQEEIFGPVLSVIRADDFDHAIEIANGTEYALTGAVFSKNRKHLEQAREQFEVGNLYFNRKCTGALVDVEPFGGFKMSGTNAKAGGRDYLKRLSKVKSVSERL